jgi:DNA-binding response OmpR family regulator
MTAHAGKILLVEDEQSLLFAVSRMLEKTGYSVLQAADGDAAVELLRRNPENVALVLLDVTLPGLSSREVLQEVRRLQPGIAVILTSALSQNEVDGSFAGFHVRHFIRKPYRLNALMELLQQVLPAG